MRLALWLGLLALLAPGVARAEWLQASSAHFVVYANDSERDIRTFSQQLERYDAAMAYVTTAQPVAPSPSNRVTIYVVSGESEVRKLYGDGSKYLGGFYLPRAGGSLAIVPRVTTGTTDLDFSMIALLHEYAHHFMISTSGFPMPRWYSEGSAEFFASASFDSDGSVGIGRPAHQRAAELLAPGFARDVTVEMLLDPAAYARSRGKSTGYDAYYGKSWLLFHYLTFNEARKGQLVRYLQLIVQGKSSRDAGLEAFGDFAKLEHELDSYVNARMLYLKLDAKKLQTGPIEVRRLSAGEAAMMPVRIRSRRGVTEEQAKALLPEARAIATRFPDDPAVLAALAEAEHDAGNDKEAIAAADAALAKDPSQVNAYVQKGLSLFDLAEKDPTPAAYTVARAPFIALNRLENDHPLPLIFYYRSFVQQGKPPTQLALNGLQRAAQLAPFDLGLRMTLAMAQLRRHQVAEARANLTPVAYNPHGGGLAETAQQVLARMDADPKWDGQDVAMIAAGADAQAGGSD